MKQHISKKMIAGGLGIVLFFLIAFGLDAPAQLAAAAEASGYTGRTAMAVLGGLAWAICWWVGMVVPDWCTALGLQCIWVLVGGIPFSNVFSAFSETTLWLIIGTFILTAAISKTGLLKRISRCLMRLFPPNYRGQVAAMMTVGAVCSPLMPSTAAKAVLGSKLAASSADLLGFENDSQGRGGLFAAAWTSFGLLAPAFLSGSFLSYSLLGSLPEGYGGITWLGWLVLMIPWGVVMLALMYLVVMKLYRQEHKGDRHPGTTVKEVTPQEKMSRQEKITAIILTVCLIFWILERTVNISAGITALAGGILCFAFGVLKGKEIASSIPWGFVLFVGVVLNVGNLFAETGLSDWLLVMLKPVLEHMSSPYTIIMLVFVVTIVIRLALASQTAVITLLTSLFAPAAISLGIHPVITGLTVYAASSCWVMLYQNPTYLAALEGMDGTIRHEMTLKAGFAYLVIALLACMVSIPYWTILGYI